MQTIPFSLHHCSLDGTRDIRRAVGLVPGSGNADMSLAPGKHDTHRLKQAIPLTWQRIAPEIHAEQ